MKIVVACPFLPYPPTDGGSIRIYKLLKGLVRRHAVRVLAISDRSPDGKNVAQLRQLCAVEIFEPRVVRARRGSAGWWRHHWTAAKGPAISYYHPDLHNRLVSLINGEQADIVLLESLKMAGYGIVPSGDAAFDTARLSRMILCRHNYEPVMARRMADVSPMWPWKEKAQWCLAHRLLSRVERRVVREYRYITAVSEQEATIFRQLAPEAEVVVVPNGADADTPASQPADDDGKTVALIGSFAYPPNKDSVRYFYRAIWPLIRGQRPDARLLVVGKGAHAYADEWCSDRSVEILESPDDPRRDLAAVSVVVVPLRAGAGTRIKIFEALAAGRAVVSTSIGREGIDVESGRHLLVGDEPAEFARHTVQLLSDPGLRRRLGQNGRALVVQRYNWESAAAALESFCESVGAGILTHPVAACR